jgi:predicted membrane channel-forming protein YqfA (hemolysin III family)
MAARVAAAGLVGFVLHSTTMLRTSRTQIFVFLLLMWLSMMVAAVAVSPISQRKARDLAGRLVFN